jgi:hypothetical protein
MPDDDYTPQQVTRALRELVAHGGDCEKTAEELLDDEFQVPVATLRRWRAEDPTPSSTAGSRRSTAASSSGRR